MNIKNRLFSYLLILSVFFSITVSGQKSLVHTNPDINYNKALELFDKEKYGSAREIFSLIVSSNSNEYSLVKCDAEYYQALCAIELFHKDADYLVDQFIFDHPDDARVNDLYYKMGKYNYQKKKYSKTINWHEKVDEELLSIDDRSDYYFQLGYSYFVKEKFDNARICFYGIKDVKSDYYSAANYFYSHIAYIEGNYQTALNGFEKIVDDEMFEPVVPYYLTHIYYQKGDYDKIKETAPALLEKSTPKRAPEIARIIGESYFMTGEYDKALPYLIQFQKDAVNYTAQDNYQLAYAYYKLGDYEKAISNFEKVAYKKDKLAQNAYFHLADCYLKTDQKTKAQMAFGSASKMSFDISIEEESLFNYAKLSFELSYSPFNQTIREFENFIQKFPNSIHNDKAYDYLGIVYLATKNYSQALASIEKISNKTESIKEAYQRIAFFRGLELFSSLEFEKAIMFFDKSGKLGIYNNSFNAQSIFWKSEAHYRLKNYKQSIDGFKEFLYTTGAITQEEYDVAHYNLAYAYFKLDNYKDAIAWFRKYISRDNVPNEKLGDSYVRIGDCYFMERAYSDAIKYYDLAISTNAMDVDYATFQKAFSYGFLREHGKKNWVLRTMVKDYPDSDYKVHALFELGRSYVKLDDNTLALETYHIIINNYPESDYVKHAWIQIGLIHASTANNEDALFAYKTVVENYGGSKEATEALIGIKNTYMSMHQEDEYFKYLEGLGDIASITVSDKDSLSFISAENLFMDGNCTEAADKFKKYIETFNDGTYLLDAHNYKAECNLNAGDETEALESFEYIISRPRNIYTENALLKAGRINFKNSDYSGALAKYTMLESVADMKGNLLEARIGQMRSSFKLKNDTLAIIAANKVLISDKVQSEDKNEAHYILAKSFMSQQDSVSAINEFKYITDFTSTLRGAEARYRVAEILVTQMKLEEAEEEILDFNKKNTPHQYWLAKSIILLADIYVLQDDDFQAKHTLESVEQYYEINDDGILLIAQEKLNEIAEREEAGDILDEIIDIELDFDKDKSGEYDELFEEETTPPDTIKSGSNVIVPENN